MALGASILFIAGSAAGAQAPQVTVYMGGYGQPLNPPPQAAPTMQGSPSMNAASALQGEATFAQLAAYERYLLYLSVVSSQPSKAANAARVARTIGGQNRGRSAREAPR